MKAVSELIVLSFVKNGSWYTIVLVQCRVVTRECLKVYKVTESDFILRFSHASQSETTADELSQLM